MNLSSTFILYKESLDKLNEWRTPINDKVDQISKTSKYPTKINYWDAHDRCEFLYQPATKNLNSQNEYPTVIFFHGGAWVTGEGKDFYIFRAPKPFELGLIFGTGTERMIEWAMSTDPKAGRKFMASVFKSLTPNMLPVAVQVPIEMKQNKSIFFDRPIIPRDRENLLPEYQHSVYTTEIAKGLSQLLVQIPGARHLEVFSPAMIEHAVRGFTGGLGAYALEYADKGLKAAGILPDDIIPPAKTMADYPVVKAFVARYPSMSTSVIEEFYKEYNSLREFSQSFKTAIKDMDIEAAEDIFNEQRLTGNMVTLGGFQRAIGNYSRMIRKIHKLPMLEGMTREQLQQFKREQIDNYYLMANQIAQAGIDLARQSRKQLQLDEE